MMLGLELESFDMTPQPEPALSSAYQDGYSAGKEDAVATAAQLQNQKTDDVLQALNDLEFTFAEAQENVLGAMGPLFNAIAEKVLPAIADHAFRSHLVQLLEDAAQKNAGEAFELVINPARCDAAQAIVNAQEHPVRVSSDVSVGISAAWIRAPNQEERFDLDEMMGKISDMLGALESPHKRKNADG